MGNGLLLSGSIEGLRPLGTPAQRAYELVTGTLRERLGEDHAALFAEPIASRQGDRIDWYAPRGGEGLALVALSDAERDSVRARLAGLSGDIRRLGAMLSQSTAGEEARLGEALTNALEVPDEDAVFAVRTAEGGLHPVLTGWGWVRDRQQVLPGMLSGAGRSRRPVPPVSAAGPVLAAPAAAALRVVVADDADGAAPPPWALSALWWLGWLVLPVLLAMILYVLIAPCDLRGPGLGNCPVVAVATADPVLGAARLEDQVAHLERALADADRLCRPVPAAMPAPPPQSPGEGSQIDQRLDQQGGQRGAMNVSLGWNSTADIDLYVTCPGGTTISYRSRSACNGTLDIDANAGGRNVRPDPIENVVFDSAAPGTYLIAVRYYNAQGSTDAIAFQVQVREGTRVRQFSGSVGPQSPEWRTTYVAGGTP